MFLTALRKSLLFILLLGLAVSIFLPFLTENPISWVTGFCYILYDSLLLCFVAYRVTLFLKTKKVELENQTSLSSTSKLSLCILVAAKNEKSVLKKCVSSILTQTRMPEQIIIVDDGSTDGSFEFLKNELQLKKKSQLWHSEIYKNVFVLSKINSGKARSLNEALDYVQTDLVFTLDADTIMFPTAVAAMEKAFQQDSALQVVGGVLQPTREVSGVGSMTGSIFKTFQKFEYIRSFLSRQAWASADCLLLVSGAFAAYKTNILKKLNGFDPGSFVEDYELIHRLYQYSYDHQQAVKVGIAADALALTDCPDGFKKFLKQRQRWFGGFLQTIFKYRHMVGSPHYAQVGRVMLPVKTIDTLQPLYGLVSLYALAALYFLDKKIHPLIISALIFKITLDYFYHFYSLYLYGRWQGQKIAKIFWIQSFIVTLLEPLFFQPLRHVGALLGWYMFLVNKSEWTAQRDIKYPEKTEAQSTG